MEQRTSRIGNFVDGGSSVLWSGSRVGHSEGPIVVNGDRGEGCVRGRRDGGGELIGGGWF